jgi:predicted protein tyrosine phosphatase
LKKENNILWESTGSGKTYVMAQTIANLKGIQKNIDKEKRMKLFICNQGENRSKTAAKLFGGKSASLHNEKNLVNKRLLDWAEVIYVFEERQRKEIGKRFPNQYIKKKIINLDIPDVYRYNQPELIKILKERFK